jgi:hypothetical protein
MSENIFKQFEYLGLSPNDVIKIKDSIMSKQNFHFQNALLEPKEIIKGVSMLKDVLNPNSDFDMILNILPKEYKDKIDTSNINNELSFIDKSIKKSENNLEDIYKYFNNNVKDKNGNIITTLEKEDIDKILQKSVLYPFILEFSQVMIPALPLELTLGKALVLCGMACSGINPDFNEYDKALYSGNTLSKVRIGGEVLGVPPNFYCINVAESGSGKDIGGLFNQLVYANRWGCSAGSPEGVADILTTKEVACLTISEMQNFFDAKRWEHKLNSFMTELFNQYRFEVALSKRGETGQRRSDYCVMNILGSIQPEIIKSLANKNLLESGFLGRCLFFNSPVHYGVPNENLINNTKIISIIMNTIRYIFKFITISFQIIICSRFNIPNNYNTVPTILIHLTHEAHH